MIRRGWCAEAGLPRFARNDGGMFQNIAVKFWFCRLYLPVIGIKLFS